jgi:hypothetical protein
LRGRKSGAFFLEVHQDAVRSWKFIKMLRDEQHPTKNLCDLGELCDKDSSTKITNKSGSIRSLLLSALSGDMGARVR